MTRFYDWVDDNRDEIQLIISLSVWLLVLIAIIFAGIATFILFKFASATTPEQYLEDIKPRIKNPTILICGIDHLMMEQWLTPNEYKCYKA